MRAAVPAGVLIFTATMAAARPFVPTMPDPAIQLTLPSQDRMAAEFARRGRADTAMIDSHEAAAPAPQAGFSIETLQVENAGNPRTGRRRQILQYRLEGIGVLGGSVGGSLGGSGPMFSLRWPTGQ